MKLSEKIVKLRKNKGWSQEEVAEKLNVSRQAISRWEGASAQPDAVNILQLSKLFGVTTDYLLNDEYESDNDLTKVKMLNNDCIHLLMISLITLEIMILIIQFMTTIILQNVFFGVMSFIPFVAVIGGFEYGYRKKASKENETSRRFHKKFYRISAWLGLYFPVRFVVITLSSLYPRPYLTIVRECVIFVLYLMVVTLILLLIEKLDNR